MNKITQTTLITTIVILCTANLKGQDFHLSQYQTATLYLNPALTGMYTDNPADYKFYADYRSQWKSITGTPYTTSYLAFDKTYKKYGLGCYFINNHAGKGGFNTFNFMLSGAYQIMNDPEGPHSLSVGLQTGVINKSFDPNSFTYDNQYDGQSPGGFDNTISSNESFDKTSVTNFDANLGVFYKWHDKSKNVHPFGGFSLYHATMPNESFNDQKQKLPIRYTFNGGADFMINQSFDLTATALYMTQAKANEMNFGIIGYYRIKDTGYQTMLGLSYRNKDAMVIQTGLNYGGHSFNISYDINTSDLSTYSGNRGAIEFSLVVSIIKGNKLIQF